MSEELHDIRTKIPTETLSVIHAIEMATGQTGAEIARKWIVAAARAELHKSIIVCNVMKGEGSIRATDGTPGGKL